MQTPSVGRIVHYQSYGTPGGEYTSLPRAAIVTEVNVEPNPGGLVGLSETGEPGCWSWPARV